MATLECENKELAGQFEVARHKLGERSKDKPKSAHVSPSFVRLKNTSLYPNRLKESKHKVNMKHSTKNAEKNLTNARLRYFETSDI